MEKIGGEIGTHVSTLYLLLVNLQFPFSIPHVYLDPWFKQDSVQNRVGKFDGEMFFFPPQIFPPGRKTVGNGGKIGYKKILPTLPSQTVVLPEPPGTSGLEISVGIVHQVTRGLKYSITGGFYAYQLTWIDDSIRGNLYANQLTWIKDSIRAVSTRTSLRGLKILLRGSLHAFQLMWPVENYAYSGSRGHQFLSNRFRPSREHILSVFSSHLCMVITTEKKKYGQRASNFDAQN